jgi:hypothetical protein
MGHLADTRRRSFRLWRLLLLAGALDALAAGAWALARPDGLFALLQTSATSDRVLLWRALGALSLCQALCLGAAAIRSVDWGGLVLIPLLGRAPQAGVWLWLLGADRVVLPARPLALLLTHDALGALVFLALLVAWWRGTGQPVTGELVREPPGYTQRGSS